MRSGPEIQQRYIISRPTLQQHIFFPNPTLGLGIQRTPVSTSFLYFPVSRSDMSMATCIIFNNKTFQKRNFYGRSGTLGQTEDLDQVFKRSLFVGISPELLLSNQLWVITPQEEVEDVLETHLPSVVSTRGHSESGRCDVMKSGISQ